MSGKTIYGWWNQQSRPNIVKIFTEFYRTARFHPVEREAEEALQEAYRILPFAKPYVLEHIGNLPAQKLSNVLGSVRIPYYKDGEPLIAKNGEKFSMSKPRRRFWEISKLLLKQGEPLTEETALLIFFAGVKADKRLGPRNFSDAILLEAIQRQNNQCPCGRPFGENNYPVGGHIVPFSQGGPTTTFNCVAQCYPCNVEQGARHFLEWEAEMKAKQKRGRTGFVAASPSTT